MTEGSLWGLFAAAVGAAAIGLERQRSGHATGPRARFGGIRTFTLLGVVAGLAGWVARAGFAPLAAVLLAGAVGLVIVGYLTASHADVDATTEASALVVIAAGFVSGAGLVTVASAVVAVTVLLLIEKSRLHALAARVDDEALRASARFAAMAFVILPLLPSGPFGPFGMIRPRELWLVVLFFSGLSFLGWMARRIVGPQQGTIVAGLLGGVMSSTTVALNFARQSRQARAHPVALAVGVIGACTVMLVRVVAASAVLNPALAVRIVPRLLAPLLIGVAVVVVARRWTMGGVREPASLEPSPLQLRTALEMTALFQVVLIVILVVQATLGPQALLASSAIVGLTDLDALTLSVARGSMPIDHAAAALTVGIVSNTLLKMTVALVIGRGVFRWWTAAVLAVMALALTGWLVA